MDNGVRKGVTTDHEKFAPQPQPVEPQPVEPQPNVFLCLFLEIKGVKGHIQSIYIKGVFIDSNKVDKHHKQYSKYGKKHSVVKLPKR